MEQMRMYMPQDDISDALYGIVATDLSACNVHVAFAAFGKGETITRFEKLEISPSLADQFREVVRLTFDDLRDDLCDRMLRVHDYTAMTKLHPHEVEHVEVSSQEAVQAQLQLLSSLTELEPFDERVEFVSDLRFYVIILQPKEGSPIYCFRSYTSKNQLRRSLFAAVKYGAGYYDDIHEPGFLFDHNVDSICRGNDMFIINKDKFQRTFQYYEFIQRDAKSSLERLRQRIPIANEDEFAQVCQQEIRIAAIVASLLDAPHVDVLSMTRIRRAIEQFQLGVQIVEEDDEEKLVYSPSTKWEFLNLICDNYLGSEITDLDYAVNSKRVIGRRGRNGAKP